MIDVTSLCPGCFQERRDGPSCPRCGYHHEPHRIPIALPVYTFVRSQYVIGRVLGRPGGFGITYLTWDMSLNVPVAIKEYFPRSLAFRSQDQVAVQPVSVHDAEAFREGLQRFVDEARTLARFDHPNIVHVRDVFEESGTAFMVMEYHEGMTLDEYVERHGGRLDEDAAVQIMQSVLDGLKVVHAAGLLHRDVKPRNIYVTTTGRSLLLDFGSARSVSYFDGQTRSIVVSPEYSAPEQWNDPGKQGPCTDVFAAGATLFFMLTGKPLPPIDKRLTTPAQELVSNDLARVSDRVRDAIATSIDNLPYRRYQTIVELDHALKGVPITSGMTVAQEAQPLTVEQHASQTSLSPGRDEVAAGEKSGNRSTLIVAFAVLVLVVIITYALNKTDIGTGTDSAIVVQTSETSGSSPAGSSSMPSYGGYSRNEEESVQPRQAEPAPSTSERKGGARRRQETAPGRSSQQPDEVPRSRGRSTDYGTGRENSSNTYGYSRPSVSKTWLVDQIRDKDGAFLYNTAEEAQEGIRKIMNSPSSVRYAKYQKWRNLIGALGSYTDYEMDQMLSNMF